jgi:hypothetical protein
LFSLVKGWSERLTLNILGVFPNVKKETLEKLKTAYNEKNQDIEAAKDGLASSDPANLADLLNIHGLFKTLKPVILIVIIIGVGFLAFKIYKNYKR